MVDQSYLNKHHSELNDHNMNNTIYVQFKRRVKFLVTGLEFVKNSDHWSVNILCHLLAIALVCLKPQVW